MRTQSTLIRAMSCKLATIKVAWQGREIGSWFWVAALVFFIAEMLIAQSFSVHRRVPSRPNELSKVL
jgi:hypothetical protein